MTQTTVAFTVASRLCLNSAVCLERSLHKRSVARWIAPTWSPELGGGGCDVVCVGEGGSHDMGSDDSIASREREDAETGNIRGECEDVRKPNCVATSP